MRLLNLSRTLQKTFFNRGLWLMLLVGLSACALPEAPGFTPPTPAPGASPTATQAPAPSATPTLTPLPSLTPTPTTLPCRQKAGTFSSFSLLSPYLKKELTYRVYFPPCYDDSGQTRYPVLYMLHGQTYNDDQWQRLGIGEAADGLINAGQARPFLIVLPCEADTFADPYAPGFGQALIETLLPWMDAFYPTCTEQACRAIGGLSRGGAWAFLLALEHPGLFGSAAGHSMVPFGGMAVRLPNQLRATPAGQLPRLWIDMGKNDLYLPVLQKYEELLTQLGVPHEFILQPGNHEEAYWAEHVEEYLRWYAAGFPAGPEP